jgi:hypothetical protein
MRVAVVTIVGVVTVVVVLAVGGVLSLVRLDLGP